jgi:hypothetical protein
VVKPEPAEERRVEVERQSRGSGGRLAPEGRGLGQQQKRVVGKESHQSTGDIERGV